MSLSISERERRALRGYVANLLKALPGRVERVILFGSKSRGEGGRTSDTDVAVVVSGRKSPSLRFAIAESAFGPIADFGVDISPLLISSIAFRSNAPLIKNIKKEGIEIWNPRKNTLAAA